ncbi:MAG TPA: phage protein Gp37 [Phycisphaerae bacterium]|nr:phage protein Gp37 [Phycisphaerae bacterium]
MSDVTIKGVEDAIVAALAGDETIAVTWKATVKSADDLTDLGAQAKARYPLIGVLYSGAPEGGPFAGGTGAGIMFARPGEFEVVMIDKSLRGGSKGRTGDALSTTSPGIYAMAEQVLAVLGYKRLGLEIKRLEYRGDDLTDVPWDERAVAVVMIFATQWETTCEAD